MFSFYYKQNNPFSLSKQTKKDDIKQSLGFVLFLCSFIITKIIFKGFLQIWDNDLLIYS